MLPPLDDPPTAIAITIEDTDTAADAAADAVVAYPADQEESVTYAADQEESQGSFGGADADAAVVAYLADQEESQGSFGQGSPEQGAFDAEVVETYPLFTPEDYASPPRLVCKIFLYVVISPFVLLFYLLPKLASWAAGKCCEGAALLCREINNALSVVADKVYTYALLPIYTYVFSPIGRWLSFLGGKIGEGGSCICQSCSKGFE